MEKFIQLIATAIENIPTEGLELAVPSKICVNTAHIVLVKPFNYGSMLVVDSAACTDRSNVNVPPTASTIIVEDSYENVRRLLVENGNNEDSLKQTRE